MGYDLAVWHSEKKLTAAEAQKIYELLADGEPSEDVKPDDRLKAFRDQVIAKYPPMDAVAEENADEATWSDESGGSDAYMFLSIAYSKAEAMTEFIFATTKAHGLVCYDPQDEEVYQA